MREATVETVARGHRYEIKKSTWPSAWGGRTSFEVFGFWQDGSPTRTYGNGEPYRDQEIHVAHPYEDFDRRVGARVSSHSLDASATLARGIAEALRLAADEAERLDEEAGL